MVDVARRSSLIHDEENRAASGNAASISRVGIALTLLLIVAFPSVLRPSASGKLPFNSQVLQQLNAMKPNFVLIGDSMLGSRIDPQLLSELVAPDCCYVMWSAGAASAWWHQALKNYALAAVHPPRAVFIFFRDDDLTDPAYRTTGQYWWRIERLSHAREPELAHSLQVSAPWQARLEKALNRIYPVQSRRDYARAALNWLACIPFVSEHVPFGSPAADRFNRLFELGALRQTENNDASGNDDRDNDYDFDGQVGNSLLPSMLEHAKLAGVPLVFVRVQRRPTTDGQPPLESPQLKDYIAKLRAFVTAEGAAFYDFNGDPQISLQDYLDGDHIRPESRDKSTKQFVSRLQSYLR